MTYKTIDFVKVRIADSFVKYNKVGRGSGEARLYVGGASIKDWDAFFENYNAPCFFSKQELLHYLTSAQFEYENPSQAYRNDIAASWQQYYQTVNDLPAYINFTIFRNNDGNNQNNTSRFYIKSVADIYEFFRCIALPGISSLLIQKIVFDDEIRFWFRLYIDDVGYEIERILADENALQIQQDEQILATEKESIIKARIGQGLYRSRIIKKYGKCVITGITDERVLIAGHIKPWVYSSNEERLSQENGVLLSPTFDALFDKGFISFRNTGMVMLSPHFSDNNFKRVGLSNTDKFKIWATKEMKQHLEFHRDVIFKR